MLHQLMTVLLYTGPMGSYSQENLMKSFQLMGMGMLGILVVMLLIWLVIFLLNRFTGNKKDKEK